MSKEIVAKQESAISTEVINDWGQENVQQRNIVIAKILSMQGLSKPVAAGVAKIGDLCDSVSGKVVCEFDNKTQGLKDTFEFIPFHCDDLWILEKKVNGKFVYVKSEKVTSANESREWNQTIDGEEWKFTRSLYFYVVLPSDPTIPYIVPFKSTSLRNGKILYTQVFVKNQVVVNGKMIVIPPLKTMKVTVTKTSNDKGTFSIIGSEISRNSTLEEMKMCKQWKDVITSGMAVVDESDAVDAPATVESSDVPF